MLAALPRTARGDVGATTAEGGETRAPRKGSTPAKAHSPQTRAATTQAHMSRRVYNVSRDLSSAGAPLQQARRCSLTSGLLPRVPGSPQPGCGRARS